MTSLTSITASFHVLLSSILLLRRRIGLPGRLGPLPVLESELDDDAELDDLVRGQRPAAHF
jgi:hypothetical protein